MSAEVLRRAASLMRERVEVATEGPWRASPSDGDVWAPNNREAICRTRSWAYGPDAEHIASWHPAVALAVAKAIDDVADAWEICDDGWTRDLDDDVIRFEDTVDGGWLNVARAYLGESS